ncbi:unnamed protein product [Oppiella nova]|uniref:BHLH domain-containing protein n=1 Tax=Oppiella nova TaxID=334625 RepID=A0A7R9QEI7_9ACAR|nr:unnamed protein product [Oppiella nova]CAG2163744.1 unnamed protein product [Oppiella nova]
MQTNTSSSALNASQTSVKLQPLLAKKSSPSSVMSGQMSPTTSMSSSMGSPELLRCKRRINFGGLGYAIPQTQPATVARRNERERNRVKMVNMGFATLRQHVPNGVKNKKMSKVETLRSAVEYIRELRELLGESDDMSVENHCSENLQQLLASDENWNPSPSVLSTSATLSSPTSMSYTCNSSANSSMPMRKAPNSPSSPNMTTSPSPSMGSDASSPYDSLDSMERQVSPEEEELFDFTNWFS